VPPPSGATLPAHRTGCPAGPGGRRADPQRGRTDSSHRPGRAAAVSRYDLTIYDLARSASALGTSKMAERETVPIDRSPSTTTTFSESTVSIAASAS
jgi:hypothetical protein